MRYSYYPGCSLERNASSYHVSAVAAAKSFNIEFAELNDWNCCGATEYIALNKLAAYALIARNLVIAKNMPVMATNWLLHAALVILTSAKLSNISLKIQDWLKRSTWL